MTKLIYTGRLMFALGMTGLAVVSILNKDFIIGRPPAWGKNIDPNPVLAYISAAILIIASVAIALNKKGMIAALAISILIFSLSVLRCLPDFSLQALNTYKAMAFFGGGLIIAASFDSPNSRHPFKKICIVTGLILLAAFFIMGGYAHFKYADFVTAFIPSYIPFRSFWAYACGIFLLAGGIGILIPRTRKWAALLSGIMLTGWFLLLHIPRFINHINDSGDRMGLCESLSFAGVLFCLAGITAKDKKKSNEKGK